MTEVQIKITEIKKMFAEYIEHTDLEETLNTMIDQYELSTDKYTLTLFPQMVEQWEEQPELVEYWHNVITKIKEYSILSHKLLKADHPSFK